MLMLIDINLLMLQVSDIVNVYVNIIYFNELFKVNVNVIVNVNFNIIY